MLKRLVRNPRQLFFNIMWAALLWLMGFAACLGVYMNLAQNAAYDAHRIGFYQGAAFACMDISKGNAPMCKAGVMAAADAKVHERFQPIPEADLTK